ncbi:dipeptide/oligopeptide/nickel ABC transporter permease/ATP-binding protein [Rhodococcus pseudokoreensis]|uniref:Dipeptide/oligopeptide/nickel ABC transporter permease/ATP-binding protein n=1 Tax=Rhodococcus pseudokoreensis TaxID=2811421 RepID=A0A974ZTL7_9NOCA|nr:dipeptide/oligopeptide/nickel ABC transporter permease/ATP-binding protein [Rhodococcus pseudokoreensis]QSE89814.1 dipeptide/oligopeptide/nickel ABC transporter permease/ATP-binding protein [Rhodococcus pseudokoreensis]
MSDTTALVSTGPVEPPRPKVGTLRTLARRPVAVASATVLLLIVLVAILAPVLAPFDPDKTHLRLTNSLPNGTYWLGGDRSGRDILSRLIYSTQATVQAALIATIVAVLLGVITGLVAGYYGRTADVIGSWIANILIAVPGIIVLITLYAAVGSNQRVAMVALGILLAPNFFRLVRAMTMSVRNEYYVDAARVSGLGDTRIIARHVLYAVRGPIIVQAAFAAGVAIALQAGLEFLGLGDAGTPSWGGMLLEAFTNIYIAPVQLVWPGIALALVVSALIVLGNCLRDTLEGSKPRMRRKECASRLDVEIVTAQGDEPVLTLDGLAVEYRTDHGWKRVVHDVSLTVARGEVLGLIGESGSGKSQSAFAVLDLLPAEARIAAGSLRLALRRPCGSQTRAAALGHSVAYIAQEPRSNLDPSFTIGQQLVEGIRATTSRTKGGAKAYALELLEKVGIADPARTFDSYPHQISGGMAQRVLIAGAIAPEPELLIADEPTTALDVTVQAEILELLRDLQEEHGMAVLLVTHNFGVVADLCDRVAVMKSGVIVETGETQQVFDHPKDSTTRALLDAILDVDVVRESDAPTGVSA